MQLHDLPLQNKEINTQNPFDIAREEKIKKIKFFCDFRFFVLSPIPKKESSEITEILQKRYNAEIWALSFKNSWNSVQTTSNSKSFTHIANHVASILVLKAFDPSGYIELAPFLFISVLTLT